MPNATDSGVAALEWSGAAGYERFRQRYGFSVPDPARYRASLRVAAIDGVRVGEWRTSPVAGVGRRSDAAGTALLMTVAEGSLRYATRSGAVDAAPGSVHLLSAADGIRFTVAQDSRFLLVMVPPALLQQPLRVATAASIGPVAPSALTSGLGALTEAVLDPAAGGVACAAARAVRSLAIAALEESAPEPSEQDLRSRILDHIDRRISDADLCPQSIATDFGISLRWVHHVFNDQDTTVARHIRERRLDLVAAQVRADHRLPRITALAERCGFASRDQLTRAFKIRFGMTIGEYAYLASRQELPRSA